MGLFLFQDAAGSTPLLPVIVVIVLIAVGSYLARQFHLEKREFSRSSVPVSRGAKGGIVVENGRRVIGVLFLIGGIVVAIFGVMYMSSPQYKTMSMVNSVTGSSQDPTGGVAIGIGAILSVIGLIALLGGSSSAGAANARRSTSPEARRLLAQGELKINNKDYDGAIRTLERMLEIEPVAPTGNFYLGSLYALKKNKNRAFEHLSLAVEQGFTDYKAIDSEFLRSQPEFREFVRNGYKLPYQRSEANASDDGDNISKLERLGELRTKGLLTEEEYAAQKGKILKNLSL